jgi:hypothetical protein
MMGSVAIIGKIKFRCRRAGAQGQRLTVYVSLSQAAPAWL